MVKGKVHNYMLKQYNAAYQNNICMFYDYFVSCDLYLFVYCVLWHWRLAIIFCSLKVINRIESLIVIAKATANT